MYRVEVIVKPYCYVIICCYVLVIDVATYIYNKIFIYLIICSLKIKYKMSISHPKMKEKDVRFTKFLHQIKLESTHRAETFTTECFPPKKFHEDLLFINANRKAKVIKIH